MKSNKIHRHKSIFKRIVLWYSTKLETNPISTKAFTSGIIAGTGDLTCQYIVQKGAFYSNNETLNRIGTKQQLSSNEGSPFIFQPDLIRTSRFTFLGFALIAPVVHMWYGLLMRKIPGTSITTVLKRTFFDQICFTPVFVPTFMTSLMILESKPFDDIQRVLQRDVSDVVVSNWALWIPAMLINFRYVPGPWQVLFSNCVGFVWNIYLSWKTQESEAAKN